MKKILLTLIALQLSCSLLAVEGMWMPQQLPLLAKDLKEKGLKISPQDISNLDKHPMTAIVSLGGCSASFVSDTGLIVTNHHCAYGSIQHNSTAENNLIDKGFYAESLSDELPGRPGSRVYVTQDITDVTNKVLDSVGTATGLERHKALEGYKKQLIAQCETSSQYRCSVRVFDGGAEYFLIKQLQIKDVRLVYAPDDSIGKYGGDVDNWMWPRHTGDFAFLRAYVDKDGNAAEFSADNVPYRPETWLELNPQGVDTGDFVMILGYPGRTSRHNLLKEIEQYVNVRYPTLIRHYGKYIDIIEGIGEQQPEALVKYAGVLAGANNRMKNYQGMLDGFAKKGALDNKTKNQQDFVNWAQKHDPDAYQAYLNLTALLDKKYADQKKDLVWGLIRRSNLLSAASTLYRLSKEKQKPDAERKSSYQKRNWDRIRNGLLRIDRSYLESVDKAALKHFAAEYALLMTEQEKTEFENMHFTDGIGDLYAFIDHLFANSELHDQEKRLAWLEKQPEDFENSNDAFIKMAVSMYEDNLAEEQADDALDADIQQARQIYIQALKKYAKANDIVMYSDANSTLRVTYGNVMGYSGKDAVRYEPFTTLNGIVEKDTGTFPFDSPQKQLDLIAAKDFGEYAMSSIDSVPVNFLADLDITGGNSGSAVLDDRARLVGLAFDGNYESINADWIFKSDVARCINVDIRYMLWVMEKVDGTSRLLKELGID